MEEEQKQAGSLKKEIQTLSVNCESVEQKRQKLAQEMQVKDNRFSCVDGQLAHVKAQLDAETHKVYM